MLTTNMSHQHDYQVIKDNSSDEGLLDSQLFAEYIEQIFFNQNDNQNNLSYEQKCKQNIFLGLKLAILTAFGLSAGISYGQVSFSVGQSTPPLGYFTGAGTTIAYGLATTWVMNEFANDFYPLKKETMKLFESRDNMLKLARGITCIILGLLTCASTIYVMEQYSSSLVLSIMAVVIDFCYKTLGYFELFEFLETRYYALRYRDADYRKTHAISFQKLNFSNNIEDFIIPHLIANPKLYDDLLVKPEGLTADVRSSLFLKRLFLKSEEIQSLTTPSKNFDYFRFILKMLVVVPALGDFTLNYYLSSQTVKPFVSTWMQVLFGFLAATPLFCLDMLGYTQTVNEMSLKCYQTYTGESLPSFTSKFYGYTISTLTRICCLVLAIFSAYVDGCITSEQLGSSDDEFIRKISFMVAIGVFTSSTVFEGFASNQILNNIYLSFGAYSKDPIKKNISQSVQKLGIFANSVRHIKDDLLISTFNHSDTRNDDVRRTENLRV